MNIAWACQELQCLWSMGMPTLSWGQSQRNCGFLWSKYGCLKTVYIQLKPVCTETLNCSFLLLDGSHLSMFPSRHLPLKLANLPPSHLCCTYKLTEFVSCYWCVSIRVHGLPDPSFSVHVSAVFSLLHLCSQGNTKALQIMPETHQLVN